MLLYLTLSSILCMQVRVRCPPARSASPIRVERISSSRSVHQPYRSYEALNVRRAVAMEAVINIELDFWKDAPRKKPRIVPLSISGGQILSSRSARSPESSCSRDDGPTFRCQYCRQPAITKKTRTLFKPCLSPYH